MMESSHRTDEISYYDEAYQKHRKAAEAARRGKQEQVPEDGA